MPASTPLLRQYLEIKDRYPGTLLLFQMGEFFETFFEDAEIASRALDIALTSRNREAEGSVPLAGFPIAAASSYISRLVKQGFKVAVCEQVEEPVPGKGLVKRQVTRQITPGVDVETDNLRREKHHYLLGLARGEGERWGLACVDISTGDFRVAEGEGWERLEEEILRLDPREILLAEGEDFPLGSLLVTLPVTRRPRDYFGLRKAHSGLSQHFGTVSLDPFGLEGYQAGVSAAGAVFLYLKETQGENLSHIKEIRPFILSDYMVLDARARRNLEILEPLPGGEERGTLVHVLDRTKTAMGQRRLREWMLYPLLSVEKIEERLSGVAELIEAGAARSRLQALLSEVKDLERLISRVTLGRANPRDFVSLRDSLRRIPELKQEVLVRESPIFRVRAEAINEHRELFDLLSKAVLDDPPLAVREGGIFRDGYHPELDRLRGLCREGKSWVVRLQEDERKRTGINSLKVGYNKVFGYYIEVTRSHLKSVPPDYERKQTLSTGERFITADLKKTEAEILTAESRIREIEFELFQELRKKVAESGEAILKTASALSDLDALSSLAQAAGENRYIRPQVDESGVIEIREGRHPVVERMGFSERFVPNDIHLDREDAQVLIITGPNMAGKSTLMRQAALIVLMAQMGSFVPAESARVGLVDRIFTRIGSGDSLTRGQSTFLVEMNETSAILRNATPKSLIILDEIGRGTSTYDGLSIAWAVAEFLHDQVGARTLFATHYHELVKLAEEKPRIRNFCLSVKEWQGEIIFLRKLVPGGASVSYGVEVARLAGLPEGVLGRARQILKNLERPDLTISPATTTPEPREKQISLFSLEEERLRRMLNTLDLEAMTPIEAMNVLNELKQEAKRRSAKNAKNLKSEEKD